MQFHFLKYVACAAFVAVAVPAVHASAVAHLPAHLQAEYENSTTPVGSPMLDNFTAPNGAYKWCHSESYQGNGWRVALTNEVKRLVQGLIEQGVVSDFEMADSNGDVSLEISQIRNFTEKGCDIITAVPGSPTGLNAAIEAAAKAGIPFVTSAASVTSPYAFNVDSNYYKWGYDMANTLAKRLGGKGNVVMVEGIAGVSIVQQQRDGAKAAFAKYPSIKVVRMVNGNWTPSVTKAVILQTLATHPAPIQGVWTTGSETRVVAEAFRQAGRPLPVITGSISGDSLGFWYQNQDAFQFTGVALLPTWIGQAMFRTASRIMDGQKPSVNTIMIPIPAVDQDQQADWYDSCMQPDSAGIFPVATSDPVPQTVFNAYFNSTAPARGWDYSQVPPACK